MKTDEALRLDKRITELEIKARIYNIYKDESKLAKIEKVLHDLLIHLELESYTETVDGWIHGHGIRSRSEDRDD